MLASVTSGTVSISEADAYAHLFFQEGNLAIEVIQLNYFKHKKKTRQSSQIMPATLVAEKLLVRLHILDHNHVSSELQTMLW